MRTFGDLLYAAQRGWRDELYPAGDRHALPSGSPTFDIFNVPVANPVNQEALLAGSLR